MTTTQQSYAKQQAAQLLETGSCDLPLNYDDVANRVARNPMFSRALRNVMNDDRRLLEMMTITAANELCKEFDL